MRGIEDLTAQFLAGDVTLEDLRTKYEELAEKKTAYELAREGGAEHPVLPDKPGASTAKALELGLFVRTLWSAQRGYPHAVKALEQFGPTTKAQTEGSAGAGGYIVPDRLQGTVIELAEGASVTEPYMSRFDMDSDNLSVPNLTTKPSVAWHTETQEATETSAVFDRTLLQTGRLDAYCIVSNELIQDSRPAIVALLIDQFIEAQAMKFDELVLTGTGTPVSGIFEAVGYSTVMSAAEVSTIVVADLIKCYHKVPSYVRNSAPGTFYLHSDVALYLDLETDTYGQYILPPYQSWGPDKQVHGFKVLESHKCPSAPATSEAAVAFGVMKYLALGRRMDTSIFVDPYSLSTKYETLLCMFRRLAFGYLKTEGFSRVICG